MKKKLFNQPSPLPFLQLPPLDLGQAKIGTECSCKLLNKSLIGEEIFCRNFLVQKQRRLETNRFDINLYIDLILNEIIILFNFTIRPIESKKEMCA